MKKHIFIFKELIEFKKENFNDYTLFLKSKLCQRHDGSYICGTSVMFTKDVELLDIENSIYKDNIYLLTDIDIYNHYIDFNQIGKKEEIIDYLESQV